MRENKMMNPNVARSTLAAVLLLVVAVGSYFVYMNEQRAHRQATIDKDTADFRKLQPALDGIDKYAAAIEVVKARENRELAVATLPPVNAARQ